MSITPVILDSDDCGWCATLTTLDNRPGVANRQTLRHFIAYIKREGSSKGDTLICEDLGDHLGAPLGALPGPKEGTVQLRAGENEIIVVYTGRVVGDDDGPFKLLKARIPVAGVMPAAYVALVRVRQVAYIVANSVPASRPAIDPFIV